MIENGCKQAPASPQQPWVTRVEVDAPDGRRLVGSFIDDDRAAMGWLWETVTRVHQRWGATERELPIPLRVSVVRTQL